MIVKALTRDVFLGFVDPLGTRILHNEEEYVPDEYAYNESFISMIQAGVIEITAYGNDNNIISRQEFGSVTDGLYKATVVAAGTDVQGAFTHSTVTSVTEDAFDLSVNNVFVFKFDSLYTKTVTLAAGFYSDAQLFAALNADAGFAMHAVASNSAGKVIVTSKSYGLNSKVEVLDGHIKNANDKAAFPASSVAVTGAVEDITISVIDSTGNPFQGAKVVVGIYDAASGGALDVSTLVQRISAGTFDDIYADECTLYSDGNGEIKFEVLDTGGSATTIHVETAAPTGYFLANVPSSRQSVTVLDDA